MPYVSRDLLRLALKTLGVDYSPLLLVSIPCMLARKIPTCRTVAEARNVAIAFGSADEEKWLDTYFKLRGGPAGKPYYMPGTKQWVQEAYPGKSLQRRRKDYDGTVFHHPDEARWALREDAAAVIKEKILQQKSQPAVPLVALMCWMWREKELKSIESGLGEFIAEIGFDRDSLLASAYSSVIPAEYKSTGLSAEAVPAQGIAELVGAAAPPPDMPELDAAIAVIEETLASEYYISAPGLVPRILGGWIVGDIVVLVGPTGSGKTALARCLSKGMQRLFGKDRFLEAFLEITPDFDTAQFLGYENLSGKFTPGRFSKEVLFVGEPTDPRLVILDEWNLSQIDAYFASVLSVVESKRPMRLPGRVDLGSLDDDAAAELIRAQPGIQSGEWVLPEDVFFLATCNSWADEPETRLPISGPVKRRCRIIPMANALEVQYREKGAEAIYEVCDAMLAQERQALQRRKSAGDPSVWDRHREARLAEVPTTKSLQRQTHEALSRICEVLLEDPQTKQIFTVGILRDVVLSCVYAQAGKDFEALGEQIADKVLHQLQGTPKVLEVVSELCRDLPNAGEIRALATRMGAFGGERRIRPLLLGVCA